MLQEISNRANKYVILLNERIREYNKASSEEVPERLNRLQLLQEINHMHIQRLQVDTVSKGRNQYQGISDFTGVGSELFELRLPLANGLIADNILTSEVSNSSGLMTIREWGQAYGTYIAIPTQQGKSVIDSLEQLNKMKTELSKPLPKNDKDSKNYFYALKALKAFKKTANSEVKCNGVAKVIDTGNCSPKVIVFFISITQIRSTLATV